MMMHTFSSQKSKRFLEILQRVHLRVIPYREDDTNSGPRDNTILVQNMIVNTARNKLGCDITVPLIILPTDPL